VPEAPTLPRLRQAVLAARDLDSVAGQLRDTFGLGKPYNDPGVEHFGLRNAVFALGDTFLEVVSPIRPDTAAGRLIDRRGGDCGYMLMFQVEDLDFTRDRAREQGVREVFEVSLDDMREVHLHPSDMRAAIVALSQPIPPESWRWGGDGWASRGAPCRLAGATVAVAQPVSLVARWQAILDAELEDLGINVSADEFERGLTEIMISGAHAAEPIEIGGVRFVLDNDEEESE
jgi:hypothetical protein